MIGSCLDHCTDRAAMQRTVTVALIVGTLLTLINQGDRIHSGDVDAAVGLRIIANFLIPWCVSSIGYISARRVAEDRGPTPPGAVPSDDVSGRDAESGSRVGSAA